MLLRLSENKIPGKLTWKGVRGEGRICWIIYIARFVSGWTELPWGIIRAGFRNLTVCHSSGLVLFHSRFNKEMKEESEVRQNVDVCMHVFIYVPICSILASSSQNRLKKQSYFSPLWPWKPLSPCSNLECLLSGPIPCTTWDFRCDLCFPPTSHWIPFPEAWSSTFLIPILVLVEQILCGPSVGVYLNKRIEISNSWKGLQFPFTPDGYWSWNSR